MRSLFLAVASVTLLLTAVPTVEAEPALDASSLELVNEVPWGERGLDLTFTTPALKTQTTVRVLLPTGYDPSGATRYPMLLLLHGGAADYRSWTELGGIADRLTKDLPLIVVMPDAGRSAWYTDWYNNGAGGPPMWETYHLRQLVPWIDANYPTVGDRSGRAIAGLSSGGFGTMSYASRHPDLFVAAAAFSGALDTNTPPVVSGKVIDALALQDRGGPGALFGLRETEEVRWRGHNPWDLASNLRGMDLTVRTGNGMAGGEFGGGGPTDPGGMFLEDACHRQSVSFHERLDALTIAHEWEDYGPGTHNFAYWNNSLAKTLPTFMRVFGEHRPPPATFSYRAVEPAYDIYGWRVSIDRPAMEFSSLDDASAAGFRLSGSGTATVETAPLYEPGRRYDVVQRSGEREVVTEQRATDDGRLVLEVVLGPGNPLQQRFTPDGASPGTTVFTTEVRVAPGRGKPLR